jgi:hypothetical protein
LPKALPAPTSASRSASSISATLTTIRPIWSSSLASIAFSIPSNPCLQDHHLVLQRLQPLLDGGLRRR